MDADGCTAAITHDGELYTWGDGAGGNLGYGNTLRQFIPRQVEKGLGDFSIVQVTFYAILKNKCLSGFSSTHKQNWLLAMWT